MFHVNPTTGEAGKCTATQGKCPFGGPNAHYTTEEAARYSFENSMAGVEFESARKRKNGEVDKRALRNSWADLELYRGLVGDGDEVFVHPQGKIVIATGSVLKVFRDGKKAGTSGKIDDLRAGRGAWKQVKFSGGALPSADEYGNTFPNKDVKTLAGSDPRLQANIAAGYPASSKLDSSRANEITQGAVTHRNGSGRYSRYGGSAILPVDERANPHKDIGDKDKHWLNEGWSHTDRTTGKVEAAKFEVWKAPRESGSGFNYKLVTTSGDVTGIGSTSGFSHDQTGARMGGTWTMVGAFVAEDGGAAVGEIPDRSAPVYTYK